MVCSLVEIYHFTGAAAFICTVTMETVGSSKPLANFYHTTWCQIPEDDNPHRHYYENYKFHERVIQHHVTNTCIMYA